MQSVWHAGFKKTYFGKFAVKIPNCDTCCLSPFCPIQILLPQEQALFPQWPIYIVNISYVAFFATSLCAFNLKISCMVIASYVLFWKKNYWVVKIFKWSQLHISVNTLKINSSGEWFSFPIPWKEWDSLMVILKHR